jgi:hypothetical protein
MSTTQISKGPRNDPAANLPVGDGAIRSNKRWIYNGERQAGVVSESGVVKIRQKYRAKTRFQIVRSGKLTGTVRFMNSRKLSPYISSIRAAWQLQRLYTIIGSHAMNDWPEPGTPANHD